jgi:hypothetical protein
LAWVKAASNLIVVIALKSALEVGFRREQVVFLAITFDVGENYIVSEVAWVARSRYEVIDMSRRDTAMSSPS